jgi:hypothetical protein
MTTHSALWWATLEGPVKERWMELCAQAAEEQNPARLLELVEEINRLLDEKINRSKKVMGARAR